jgi:hypothetical protein
MKGRSIARLMVPFLFLFIVKDAFASVEWTVSRTLKLEKPPVDVAFSSNGRWIFVLTDEGAVDIYSADGKLNDRITAGKDVDGVKTGPREDILFLISKKNKTVEEISLDFIYEIDTAGSPFKGKDAAPVVITVFSDFQ